MLYILDQNYIIRLIHGPLFIIVEMICPTNLQQHCTLQHHSSAKHTSTIMAVALSYQQSFLADHPIQQVSRRIYFP